MSSAKRTRATARVPFETKGPTMTKQAFRDECDINNVMRRFERDGVIDHTNKHRGDYGHYLNAPSSYHEAMHQTIEAREMFEGLPAKVRREFANDPGRFLDTVSAAETGDQEATETLRKLKLLPSKKPAPEKVPAAEPKGEAPAPAASTSTD